ncbi:MAG: acetyl-CoA hydrolase/transferase C-terminal domain-containing protein [Pseudomonadota bacterium]
MTEASAGIDLLPHIRPGDTVIWGQAHAQPLSLIKALVRQRRQIGHARVFLGIGHDLDEVLTPEHADHLEFFGYCAAGSNRRLVKAGAMDIIPIHYSEMARRMRDGSLRMDVVFLQLPAPDGQGRYSMGMCRDYIVAALASARTVIAEVDDTLPWTNGGPYLDAGQIDLLVKTTDRQPAPAPHVASPVEEAIARHAAGMIPDGATLQTGIGILPDVVLGALTRHRDLGMHTGNLGDGTVLLAEAGALTNSRKTIDPGIIVCSMVQGGERLRRFVHRNAGLEMRPVEYTHAAATLARIDRFVAINGAIEVDLTGQINSEIAGGHYVGAVGGALDFVRGASSSSGGIPIIVLPSTARGRSRIVHALSGPATVPRSDACVIVTEHGVADLRGLTLRQRVVRMLAIADPAHRKALEQAAAG